MSLQSVKQERYFFEPQGLVHTMSGCYAKFFPQVNFEKKKLGKIGMLNYV